MFTLFRSINQAFRRFVASIQPSGTRGLPRRARPTLEELGPRIVPAGGLTWTWSGAGGNFNASTTQNWAETHAGFQHPGNNDFVVVPGGAGNAQKNILWDIPNVTLESLKVQGNYGGTVRVSTDVTAEQLLIQPNMATARLSIDALKAFHAAKTTLTNAVVEGSGWFHADNDPVPQITTNANVQLNVSRVEISAAAQINVNALLSVGGSAYVNNLGWFILNADMNVVGGAAFNNAGLLTLDGARQVTGFGNLFNNGSIEKRGAGAGGLLSPFHNLSSLNGVVVNAGTLAISGLGTDSGKYYLYGGTQLFLGSRSVLGPVLIDGPDLATLPPGVAPGVVRLRGVLTTAAGSSLTTYRTNFRMENDAVIAVGISGAGNVSFSGPLFEWNGGSISGFGADRFTVASVMSIGFGGHMLTNTKFARYLPTTWTGGEIILVGGAEILNYNTFTVEADDGLSGGTGQYFRNLVSGANRGVLNLANADEVLFDVDVVNNGDLLLNTKAIQFNRTFVQSGTGYIRLEGGTIGVDDDQTFFMADGFMEGSGTIDGNFSQGGGTVRIPNGTLRVKGNYSQAQTAALDFIFSDGFGKLQVDDAATLNGLFDVSIESGTPAGWYDIVTATAFTDPVPTNPPAGYEFNQTATALRMRKTP